MADPNNPPGQPASNPFMQGPSSPTVAPKLDFGSAEQALDTFLSKMMGNYKSSWERIEADRIKAEEQFYRSIGNLSKSHHLSALREKSEYIAKLRETTDAQIRFFEEEARAGKKTAKEVEQAKLDANNEFLKKKAEAEDQTNKKIAQESKRLSLENVGGKISGLGGKIGGPVGAIFSNIGGFVSGLGTPEGIITAAVSIAIGTIFSKLNREAQQVRIGASLAQAGLGLNLAGAVPGIQANVFGGLGTAVGPKEQERLLGVIAQAPKLLGDAISSNKEFLGTMGLFANVMPDATKIIETMTMASHDLGMSFSDMQKLFFNVRSSSKALNMSFDDTLQTQLSMQASLRNLTTDGSVASTILTNISGYLRGIKASPAEAQRFAGAIASGVSNLSLSQIVGMAGFVGGGRLPTHEQLFGGPRPLVGAGTPQLLGQFLTNVMRQAGPQGTLQADLVASQLAQQFIPGLPTRGIAKFEELARDLTKPGGMAKFTKGVEDLKGTTPEALMQQGITKIATALGPMGQFENFLANWFIKVLDDLDILSGKKAGSALAQARHIAVETTGIPAIRSLAKKIAGTEHTSK